jgi:nucleotidyltransferase/DNA polymerase involved in DNA repair
MFRVIAHLDMDAFSASVEQRDHPALRSQPVIVGAPPTQRGVVCAASYEARKFGVRSAMPSATIGIAANKLLAKIASDHQKPDGLTLIPEKEKVSFLRPLPVRALYGVGKVTEGVLHGAGLQTVGDLHKVRYGDFTTLTRQITMEEPLTEASDIYRLGCFLLGRQKLVSRPLRLLGLGVSSLRESMAKQLVLL